MLWARIESGAVIETAHKHGWIAAEGWLPVEDDRSPFDPLTQALAVKPESEWAVEAARVVIAYDVVAKAPEAIEWIFARAIQSHVDATAIAKRYDSGNSLATYKDSTVPQWAAEAAAFIAWRDAVWAYSYAELDKVLNDEREQPTVEAFIAELPAIVWPD